MSSRARPRLAAFLVAAWLCALATSPAYAQEPTPAAPEAPAASTAPAWAWTAAVALYAVPDEANYLQPMAAADRGLLHLEARYNYEAQKTFSAWAGMNFEAGETVTMEFTPMFGVITGDLDGVAPGFLLTLSAWKLTFYSEGEFVFDASDEPENFFYNWSELTIQPTEWFRTGLVTQRTRAYQTERDIQRGLLVGAELLEGLVDHERVRALLRITDSGRSVRRGILDRAVSGTRGRRPGPTPETGDRRRFYPPGFGAGFDNGSPALPRITTEIFAGSVALSFAEVLCTDPIGSKNDCPASSTFAGSPLIAHRILPLTT